jgi:ABC-type glycerol-3-phosphate transport system substrate-binding protein
MPDAWHKSGVGTPIREGRNRRPSNVWLASLLLVSACRPGGDAITIAVALLPSELPVYRAVLRGFERETGRRLVVVPQQYADIRRALAAEAAADRGTLDLVELDVYSLAPAAPWVEKLDSVAFADELAAIDSQAIEAGQVDGLRFLPHRLAWQAMIYDHERLPDPPETWDELLAVARAHPGQVALKGALYEGLTCDVLPFVWSAGGSGETLDDAGARAAFRFLADLGPFLHPDSQRFKEPTIAEAMARGEVLLHFNWPFTMSLYASQGLAPARIRSAPLPRGPRGRATVLGGGYVAMPKNAPHRVAAIQLAHFLLRASTQRKLARRLGWLSARRDVRLADPQRLLVGFVAMRDGVRPRPRRPDYMLLSRLWQQAFRAVAFEHDDPVAVLEGAEAEFRQSRVAR